ncbi:hypothetical protein [Erythrobacter mangrovi]|uniref:Secreted protein n=1 Tax=Erythrobacter mangrovi TaxID=2739433 RepID=A0A7D3XI85_9SPHN|nr:hypothetical protein [Erythrobacter mangrovi]QKG71913.1 hypothetical protein HQR01_11385 [Erythrobacter mangrovi]
MPTKFSFSAIPALAAALSLTATPTSAAELPVATSHVALATGPAWAPGDDTAHNHRWYRYRRHRGVDAGDVLAGILIVGGIAAIASAASNADRRSRDDYRYRYPEPRRDSSRYNDSDTRGIDRAVSICSNEIERNVRIDSIDSVNRTAQGWQVSGALYNGDGFSCSIGNNGRIEAISYGSGADTPYRGGDAGQGDYSYDQQEDAQYDDDTYAQARARVDGQDGAQPAYPGGPLPGEEPIDGDLSRT